MVKMSSNEEIENANLLFDGVSVFTGTKVLPLQIRWCCSQLLYSLTPRQNQLYNRVLLLRCLCFLVAFVCN